MSDGTEWSDKHEKFNVQGSTFKVGGFFRFTTYDSRFTKISLPLPYPLPEFIIK